ncbi:TPA: hypothetical protein I8Y21_006230 [Klebsiella oxytoca]|uniref:Uncharacterized protein n=1 Tax=Klebsiella oxytoca TaxID=571 RepID=A0AAN5LEY5_KLEOX|nr:hypothetical protein [Klebsiella oxytoca]
MGNLYEDTFLSDSEVTLMALSIIKEHLHGMSVGQACRVLLQTEQLFKSATMIDCTSELFQKADEELSSACSEEPRVDQDSGPTECADYFKT